MPPNSAVDAIRGSVAYARRDDIAHLHISGANAHDVLNRACSADLRMRDGQMLQTLLLNDDATCFADVYVASDDEEFFLIGEGPRATDLASYVRDAASGVDGITITDRSDELTMLTLDGPFAWELLGRAVGQETVGLPYLTFFRLDGMVCHRAGKTGEYGYGLAIPRDRAGELYARFADLGASLDAHEADTAATDQCALENWFFNIRREGRAGLTPLELQLQWRVSYGKEYIGSRALRARREAGAAGRVTCTLGPDAIATGDTLMVEGVVAGRVLSAGPCSVLDEWVSMSLIDLEFAHPGIAMSVTRGDAAVGTLRTVSPPVLNNRSLFVSPQIHSYATRQDIVFPPLRRR